MSFLDHLTTVDWISLGVVVLFAVLGLFRGFLWQASRLVSLVVAYVLAGVYGSNLAGVVERNISGVEGRASYYIAYFTIFVAVLILLSLLTMVLDRFIKKLELSFYDHLGGSVLGVVTAAGLIIAVLGILYRVFPSSSFVVSARESVTGDVSRFIVDKAGLPDTIRELYVKPTAKGPKDGK